MELSVLCLLTVALAFVPLTSALEEPLIFPMPLEKPGVCPSAIMPFVDRRTCPRPCSSDYNCKGSMKCCASRCGRICMEPERVSLVKPGECPRLLVPFTDRLSCVPHPRPCTSDRDCRGKMKCCQSGCGRMCMEPEKDVVKPGECPRLLVPFTDRRPCQPLSRPCTSDGDCKGRLKCCQSRCGRMCMEPEKDVNLEKPGKCPRILPFQPCQPHEMQCTSDRDCKGRLKCCQSRCGRMCMEPEKDVVHEPKPGTCPRPIGFGTCVNNCNNDQDCLFDLKCCSNGCGRTCMKPATDVVKPGECPRLLVPFTDRRPCQPLSRPCTSDGDCKGRLKCCQSRCGRMCMEPEKDVNLEKPGKCPRILLFQPCQPHEMQCTSDRDCKGRLKCCQSRCGRMCMEPEKDDPKPGICPRPNVFSLLPCPDKCSDDNQCPRNLKCCYNGCGKMCVSPIPWRELS